MAYRILIWSTPQARIVPHGALDHDGSLLEQLSSAGRAAMGLPPRGAEMLRRAKIARAHAHLARAKTLLEEL